MKTDPRFETTNFDQVGCQHLSSCGWPECNCPRKTAAHSDEAVNYAFNKARELLVGAGFTETAAILNECRPGILGVAQTWQDISTAPKGGEVKFMDLWWVHNAGEHESYRRPDCFWHTGFEGWVWDGIWGGRPPKNWTATHWMPRPAPPMTEAQIYALRWLGSLDYWESSPFYVATMRSLVRKGYAKERGGVGRPGIRLPVEWRITDAGRAALSVTRPDRGGEA